MMYHMLLYTTHLYQFKLTFVLTSPHALCDSQSEGSAVSHGVSLTFIH